MPGKRRNYKHRYQSIALDKAYRSFVKGEASLPELVTSSRLSLATLKRRSTKDGWVAEREERKTMAPPRERQESTAAAEQAQAPAPQLEGESARSGEAPAEETASGQTDTTDLLDQLALDVESAYLEERTRLAARGQRMQAGKIGFIAKSYGLIEEARRNKGGRPKKDIKLSPEALVLDLAEMQCTQDEIAAVLGISTDTVRSRFSTQLKKGKDKGKASLRRVQWDIARSGGSGAATMAIWLGKQMLEQTDKADFNHNVGFTDEFEQWIREIGSNRDMTPVKLIEHVENDSSKSDDTPA